MNPAIVPIEAEAQLAEGVARGVTLVDFWAPWCGPCRTVAALLEELAEEWGGSVRILKVDTEASPELAARYGVQAVPSLLLFKDGRLLDRAVGAGSKARLKALVRRASEA